MYINTQLTFWNTLMDAVNPILVPSSAKLLYLITLLWNCLSSYIGLWYLVGHLSGLLRDSVFPYVRHSNGIREYLQKMDGCFFFFFLKLANHWLLLLDASLSRSRSLKNKNFPVENKQYSIYHGGFLTRMDSLVLLQGQNFFLIIRGAELQC